MIAGATCSDRRSAHGNSYRHASVEFAGAPKKKSEAPRSSPTHSRSCRSLTPCTGTRIPRATSSPASIFPEPITRFELTVELTAELAETNPFDFFPEPEAATWPFRYPALLEQELTPYRTTAPIQPWLADLLAGLRLVKQPSVDLLIALNHLVETASPMLRAQNQECRAPETLERACRSCRDVAWLLVRVARNLGYAARSLARAGSGSTRLPG
jgi:hypothetical protein